MKKISYNFAFACDQYMMPGLLVSMYSLLKNFRSKEKVDFFIISQNIPDSFFSKLSASLDRLKKNYEIHHLNADLCSLGKVRLIHNRSTLTYARMLLPDLLPDVNSLIYFDSDLLIQSNFSEINVLEFLNGYPLSASLEIAGPKISSPMSFPWYAEYGLDPDQPWFNAGVLLLDLEQIRKQSIFKKALEFSNTYPEKCLTWDQTALNVQFYKQWKMLPRKWNFGFYPLSKAHLPTDVVLHFLANPKPWALSGWHFHAARKNFKKILSETLFLSWSPWKDPIFWNYRDLRTFLKIMMLRRT